MRYKRLLDKLLQLVKFLCQALHKYWVIGLCPANFKKRK